MKNLKRVLSFVLVCVLIGGLLPMTAAAEDIKITSMEFSVENLKVGEKGTALKAHVAGNQPITLNHLASLRYDDAGEPGLLVKSDLLQEGKIYWLCINPVVKSGYSLTPYVMLQKESWTINGLPYGMAIDKVVQSGSQVRFRLTPLLKAIDTLSITGVPAPKYGQKVKEYYTVWTDVFDKGTGKVNGVAYAGNWLFEGIFLAAGAILNEGKQEINPETQISADTYYMWYMFECVPGRVFTEDIQVSVEGAISAEAEFYDDALLVYAKYEVSEPIFTKQPVGGTVASGETKTVKWTTNFPPVKNVLLKVKTHPVDGIKITYESLGTATTAEVGAGYEYYIIRSYYSDSGYVNSEKFYVNELETCTVTFDSDGGSAVAAQTVEDGKTATKPADPTKEGYTFKGWYLGSTAYDFSKPVTGNITLTAKWEKVVAPPVTYTVTFDPNGGSVTPTTKQTDASGWLTGLPTPTHSDPNKLFDGWHTSKTSYSKIADKCKFSKDTTLYAHWKDKPAHTIAEVYIESVQIPAAGVMPSNQVNITTSGVQGITDSGDTFWVRYDAATNNLTDTYEDDTHVDSVPFRAGETYLLMLAMEAQPTYGFTPDVKVFYKGKELPAPSMSDMTASAILDHDDEYICVIINPGKAENTTYTVTFDSDGGSAVVTQTVEKGKAAAKPADPTRSGYTFKGWYLGSTKYDFSKPITGNITLKAKWEKKHTHTYDDIVDGTCNGCGAHREDVEIRQVVHMFRMYNPNTGEHFYTGSTVERDNLIGHGWQYEGVGFTFPANTGAPVYRLFHEPTGEHLYTMDKAEKEKLEAEGWNYEGIAFNSAYNTEAVQHRLHNPNATVGAYHFTFSLEEKQNLIDAGWEYQGIGWYSCWK